MPDSNLANELLNKKYSEEREAGPKTPINLPFSPEDVRLGRVKIPEQVDWKFIASERLQMLIHFQDESNEWKEAYQKERDRADMFMSLYLDSENKIKPIDLNTNKTQEVKHTVQSPSQVRTRRASWPEYRTQAEKLYSGSAHDAGIQEKENEKDES